jgi:imidazolonepropionase
MDPVPPEAARRVLTRARIASVTAAAAATVVPGAIALDGGRIAYAGPVEGLPEGFADAERVDCEGRLVTPGLVDCHTHLVYAGDRADEFERRLGGATYQEIAAAGGGIASSVRALRAASEADLTAQSLARLKRLTAEGVTTVEIKSGYGLDTGSELKTLRVARRLGGLAGVTVRTTFLGAHTVPPEWKADRGGYLDLVVGEMLPAIVAEGLADAVDAFMETVAFSGDEVRRVFAAAKAAGLPVKLHADQLTAGGGAALAAAFGALSADHLEYTDEAGARAMAGAGTVAVLLPGAFYFLRETRKPPVELFRRHGVPMAIATDCNPGTSPLTSLLLAMNMAATLYGLTVGECLAGVTREAARALGLASEIGTIEAGKRADLAIWDAERPAELVYALGANPLHARIHAGVLHPATAAAA